MPNEGGSLARRYQFQVDGRGFGNRVHAEWHLAARDAVADGYAVWVSPTELRLDDGATIAEID